MLDSLKGDSHFPPWSTPLRGNLKADLKKKKKRTKEEKFSELEGKNSWYGRILGCRRNTQSNILTYSRLNRWSLFVTPGSLQTLISASAIPHCGCTVKQRMMTSEFSNKNGCFLGLKLVKVKGSRSRPSTY